MREHPLIKRHAFIVGLPSGLGLLAGALGAIAASPGRASAAADDTASLVYDDPAVHFEAPAGWRRVAVQPAEGAPPGTAVVAFVSPESGAEQKTISLAIEPYDGSLDGFATSTESDLRSSGSSVFIDAKTKTALANGMPAWWLRVTAGSDAGQLYRRFEYVTIDTTRGITAAVIARLGALDEATAKSLLSTLRVVVYPSRR